MKRLQVSLREKGKLVLCILVALAAVEFLYACEDPPTDPSKNSNCGTGNVQWDVKAQICRDLGRNAIVPASCCGY
jgi:hypothetical protein